VKACNLMKANGLLAASVAAALLASAPAAAEETGRSFEIYGFAQADAIYDFGRMNPDWDDAFRPSKIANPEGIYGTDGQASVSVKQSRFGVKGTMPTAEGRAPINFKFEFDLFGVGGDAGQTNVPPAPCLRRVGLAAGRADQQHLHGHRRIPNVIDYWDPTHGLLAQRADPLDPVPDGVELVRDRHRGAEQRRRPRSGPRTRPALGDDVQSNEEIPNLAAHYRTQGGWGHVQIAGILRSLGYDTKGTPNNEPKDDALGWGVNLSGTINTWGKDKILWQYVYGHGIASYMNDGGMDLAPEGRLPTDTDPGNVDAEAVPLTGIVAYYDHYWSEEFSTSIATAPRTSTTPTCRPMTPSRALSTHR